MSGALSALNILSHHQGYHRDHYKQFAKKFEDGDGSSSA